MRSYGPVTVSAHRLESTVAEYPRAVLGHGVLQYLHALEHAPQSSPDRAFAAGIAADCTKLICEAPDDRQPMLHFLSPALLGPPDLDPLLHNYDAKAYKWVKDEQDKHTAAGDEKLRERYQRLATLLSRKWHLLRPRVFLDT